MRSRLIHSSFDIDLRLIWDTAHNGLLGLIARLESLGTHDLERKLDEFRRYHNGARVHRTLKGRSAHYRGLYQLPVTAWPFLPRRQAYAPRLILAADCQFASDT